MVHQTMIEWSSPAEGFARGLGDCIILQNTLGCYSCNPQFLVMLTESGELRTVDQNCLALYGNPSDGRYGIESELIKKWREELESKKETISRTNI